MKHRFCGVAAGLGGDGRGVRHLKDLVSGHDLSRVVDLVEAAGEFVPHTLILSLRKFGGAQGRDGHEGHAERQQDGSKHF